MHATVRSLVHHFWLDFSNNILWGVKPSPVIVWILLLPPTAEIQTFFSALFSQILSLSSVRVRPRLLCRLIIWNSLIGCHEILTEISVVSGYYKSEYLIPCYQQCQISMIDFHLKKEQRETTHAVGICDIIVIWRTGLSTTNAMGRVFKINYSCW